MLNLFSGIIKLFQVSSWAKASVGNPFVEIPPIAIITADYIEIIIVFEITIVDIYNKS